MSSALRNRLLLLVVSLVAVGWAWYSRAHEQPMNRALTLVVVGCFVAGLVMARRGLGQGMLRPKELNTPTNWLRAAVALLPFLGLAFRPEIPNYEIPPAADRSGGHHSWAWIESDGHYFVEVDRGTEQAVKYEITKGEYDEVQKRGAVLAATVLLIFAYVAACFAWFMLMWPLPARPAPAS